MNERSEEIQHTPSSNASGCSHGGDIPAAVPARSHDPITSSTLIGLLAMHGLDGYTVSLRTDWRGDEVITINTV